MAYCDRNRVAQGSFIKNILNKNNKNQINLYIEFKFNNFVIKKFIRFEDGKLIESKNAIIYDFIPFKLGNQFRIDNDLKERIFTGYEPIENCFAFSKGYEKLGEYYLEKINAIKLKKSLESYKISMIEKMYFSLNYFESGKEYTNDEKELLNMNSTLQNKLLRHFDELDNYEKKDYISWMEKIRNTKIQFLKVYNNEKNLLKIINFCIDKKLYQEAMNIAISTENENLVKEVTEVSPKPLLDYDILEKFI